MRTLIAITLLVFTALTNAQQLTLSGGASLDGMAQPDFLPVEQAYQLALEVTDQHQVRLYWQIADEYYLYQKRFAFTMEDEHGPIGVQATLPEGIEREDEYFGLSVVYYQYADIQLQLERPTQGAILTVTSQGCADAGLCYPPQRERFLVDTVAGTIAPGDTAAGTGATAAPARPVEIRQASNPLTILTMMALAFLGGTILNLMPCVFPVLSLKVFSFATGSEHSKHVHGWVYAAGVVLSFILVAGILIALQHAGSAVGWGFQLQSTRFVALLAFLFFAMGLGLSGLVEFGSGMMGVGGNLADRGGYSGSFFTGVLATVVASPCTAPFMGTALGFAVTQPAVIALSIFAALGAGMAAPMLVLSYSRTLRERMPRPGPWMETFRQLLAFPLYATAIWLLWVAGRQTGVNGIAWLLGAMLLLAMGLWMWRFRSPLRLIAVAAIGGALLSVTSPLLSENTQGKLSAADDSSAFSDQRLEQLLQTGQPVFINVTADWCITCIANERNALSDSDVQEAMTERGIVYLKADWTNYNPDIADFLKRFNRNGIPLYLLYSGKPGAEPLILPQLLTPGTLLDAFSEI